MIYGICGRKGHGKDTFANKVKKLCPEFKILHFADTLKQMAKGIWDLSDEQLNDPVQKEVCFDKPIVMDDYLELMILYTGLDLKENNKIAESPRKLLQYFGTDYVRAIDFNYWVNEGIKAANSCEHALFADVRFINEVKAIKAVGGKIIKIIRNDALIPSNEHISEKEVDNIDADLYFWIRGGDFKTFDECVKSFVDSEMGNKNG